jgi:protein tyrosine phosphatase (PTP) superfamily phosphohydrolase (DUF442 family)
MFIAKLLLTHGTPRGKPGLPGGHGRRLAVSLALGAACLIQTGCQSGPFSPCGFIGRTTSRVMAPFHRDRGACCGSEVVADGCVSNGCVSSGVPVEGVVTGAAVAPGVIVSPQTGTPSTVAPADSPSSLEPLGPETPPNSRTGPPPGSTRRLPSGTGTGSRSPSTYDSLRPDFRSTQTRGNNLARSLVSSPEAANRTARAGGLGEAQAQGDSALDHLPPLDLPGEVTEKNATPPVAPAAERKPQTPAPAGDPLGGRSPRESDLTLTGSSQPPSDPTSTAGPVPGIARFASVDQKLAGGSAPSTAGLDWLVEKGYRTLVDLRQSTEVDAAFIAEAARRGLRYIAMPVSGKTIEREHVARFNFELRGDEARPLYFFDSSGARAGALWYIRRITVDQVTSQDARREAIDLGCVKSEDWLAATSYLDRIDKPRSQSADTAGPPAPAAAQQRSSSGL